MFVWRLWGDVWVVDSDPLTAIIGNLLILCFMIILTLAVLAVWLPFMGIKWAIEQGQVPSPIASSGTVLVSRGQASSVSPHGDDVVLVTSDCHGSSTPTLMNSVESFPAGTVLRLLRDDDRHSYKVAHSDQVLYVPKACSKRVTPGEVDAKAQTSHARTAAGEPCPNCGSTSSRDIRPCIRCGK
jgi:hypothetical protein